MSRDDGGPAFQCRRCGASVTPRGSWHTRDGRCLPCKRDQQNAANLAKGDVLKVEAKAAYIRRQRYYVEYWQRQRNDPLHIQKRAARRKVSTEIEAGRLIRQACALCFAPKADAHHHDYTRPLDIAWLCRRCHLKEGVHGRTEISASV